MDQVSNYRQIICQFLQDFAQGDRKAQLIFNLECDRSIYCYI
ncbi:MAG: hypothetical protein WBM44_26430 [Waterburya sp.]